MSCEYVGDLRPSALDAEGPVAVYVCRACPGGQLVIDPAAHDRAAHPIDIPAPRAPRED